MPLHEPVVICSPLVRVFPAQLLIKLFCEVRDAACPASEPSALVPSTNEPLWMASALRLVPVESLLSEDVEVGSAAVLSLPPLAKAPEVNARANASLVYCMLSISYWDWNTISKDIEILNAGDGWRIKECIPSNNSETEARSTWSPLLTCKPSVIEGKWREKFRGSSTQKNDQKLVRTEQREKMPIGKVLIHESWRSSLTRGH